MCRAIVLFVMSLTDNPFRAIQVYSTTRWFGRKFNTKSLVEWLAALNCYTKSLSVHIQFETRFGYYFVFLNLNFSKLTLTRSKMNQAINRNILVAWYSAR